MASRAGISGLALAEIGLGVILAWSGVENATIAATIRSLVGGRKPQPGPPGPSSASSAGVSPLVSKDIASLGTSSDVANRALGKIMAARYGWATGQDWQALNYGWGTLESGWSSTVSNPGSGAFGIAQALGHGTPQTAAPNGENEYGPDNGISVATARAANEGSPSAQIAWGLAYIAATYGKPSNVPGWLGQPGYQGY